MAEPWELAQAMDRFQQGSSSFTFRDGRRLHLSFEQKALGIDQNMPLASLDFLSSVVAP